MIKIIIGATGSLTQYVIETAQKLENTKLSLLERTTNKIPAWLAERTTLVQDDTMKINDLETTIAGQNIVYMNWAEDLDKMSQNIISAMKGTGVNDSISKFFWKSACYP